MNVLLLTGTFPESGESDGIELSIAGPAGDYRHVFVPHLCPDETSVIGDFVFRAPAIILATSERAVAYIPDLDDIAAAEGYRAWLDYDHPNRRVTFGAGDYRMTGHVFFERAKVACRGQSVRLRLLVQESTAIADIENPYGMAARYSWSRWGRPNHQRSARPSLGAYMKWAHRWAFSESGWDSVWQSLRLDGEDASAPVFIVDVSQHPSVPEHERRWREPPSIWNQAWFSTQRCANGLLRHARRIGSADLERRARSMTRIALAAPQRDGLFPSVLANAGGDRGWTHTRWTNSDRRPPSVSEDACHLVDAAFTCKMLLEWHALTGDREALDKVVRFARRLVTLQRPSGAFPGWIEPDGRVAAELIESAETAVCASLLLDPALLEHRDSADRAIGFLETVIRDARWEDFETYYSCAPWGAPDLLGKRVPRNGVFKQNTLSIAWCMEAMMRADRLDLARRCADELSLYQAVWSPTFLPAPAIGGFGVMNADSEWNDARQSLFAPLYLELHERTGDAELLERGVAALFASFSMMYCPENPAISRAYERRFPFFGPESYGFMMENQGHGAADPIGTFSIYTWGAGSALAAAATVRDRFPRSVDPSLFEVSK